MQTALIVHQSDVTAAERLKSFLEQRAQTVHLADGSAAIHAEDRMIWALKVTSFGVIYVMAEPGNDDIDSLIMYLAGAASGWKRAVYVVSDTPAKNWPQPIRDAVDGILPVPVKKAA